MGSVSPTYFFGRDAHASQDQIHQVKLADVILNLSFFKVVPIAEHQRETDEQTRWDGQKKFMNLPNNDEMKMILWHPLKKTIKQCNRRIPIDII